MFVCVFVVVGFIFTNPTKLVWSILELIGICLICLLKENFEKVLFQKKTNQARFLAQPTKPHPSLSLSRARPSPTQRAPPLTYTPGPPVSLSREALRARALTVMRDPRVSVTTDRTPLHLPSFLPQIPSPSITAAIRRRELNHALMPRSPSSLLL